MIRWIFESDQVEIFLKSSRVEFQVLRSISNQFTGLVAADPKGFLSYVIAKLITFYFNVDVASFFHFLPNKVDIFRQKENVDMFL